MEQNAQQQQENSKVPPQLRPWQFQPGKSGNPGGRPKGTVSLKEFAKRYIQELTDEEKLEFMSGLDKNEVWRMAEGNPKNDLELAGKVTFDNVISEIENGNQNDNREHEPSKEVIGQIVADIPAIQNPQQEQGVSNVQAQPSASTLPTEQVVEKYNPEEPATGIHNG